MYMRVNTALVHVNRSKSKQDGLSYVFVKSIHVHVPCVMFSPAMIETR